MISMNFEGMVNKLTALSQRTTKARPAAGSPPGHWLTRWKHWLTHEVVIHAFLWVVYFMAILYERDLISERTGEPAALRLEDFVFTINYFLVVLAINYWLLPRFLYRKEYLKFFTLSTILLVVAILVEEFVMEAIFYANTRRATYFTGFFRTLLDIGPTILFFVGFKLAWDNLKKQSDLEQAEREKVESQLQFLKAQLNPHFLFNNLNNLYAYAQEGSHKTPEIILQLSSLMRYMLYESRDNFVPLAKELDYLSDFIQLQELQMEGRGQVDYVVEGRVHSQQIAPFMLIAFVENCFKHSLSSQSHNISIQIMAHVMENRLLFHCANTYARTVSSADDYLGKGIGLENVRKRLQLLYPQHHRLDIYTREGTYFVDLELDLAAHAL